jgi:hypothetical protein
MNPGQKGGKYPGSSLVFGVLGAASAGTPERRSAHGGILQRENYALYLL